MKTAVSVRNTGQVIAVNISDNSYPIITEEIYNKWQSIINSVAKIMNVPAGLIMKITQNDMEVYLRSTNKENPYPSDGKDKLGHGLYCETVIGTDNELLVGNALIDDKWKDNPDVKLNMIAYYGLPIKWNSGSFFGTICVLDNKTNSFNENYMEFLKHMRDSIETDLKMLEVQEELKLLSIKDFLTEAYNRKYVSTKLESLINTYKENKKDICVIMFDFDKFKLVNDNYGHLVGDQILIRTIKIIKKELNKNDIIARYGGDEFIVTLEDCSLKDGETFINTINNKISANKYLAKYNTQISCGITLINDKLLDFDSLIKNVDFKMLRVKKNKYK